MAHVYSAGFHVAVLTVTDAQGLFDVTSIEIRVAEDFLPLVNNIAAFPGFGPAPLSVQFTTDAFGGNDTQYLWDFGDGETSTLKEPLHTFVYVGEFTVRQIITDENGDIDQTDMQITVNP